MEAIAWTVTGILAATVLSWIGICLAQFGRIDGRFDRIDTRFDGIDARFDAMGSRIDALVSEVANLGGRISEHVADHRHHPR